MPGTIQTQSLSPARDITKFSPQRIARLIRNRIFQDLIPLGIGGAIILGVNLIRMVFSPHQAFFNHLNSIPWGVSVTGACCILSASAFREMQSGKSETDWLLLPATPLEKYLAAVIEMAILIPMAAMAIATTCSAFLAGIEHLAGAHGGSIWTILDMKGREGWGLFVVLISFILTGATIFRKQVLLKSVGLWVAYQLVFAVQEGIIFEIMDRQLLYPGGRTMAFKIALGNGNISYTAAPAWLLNIYVNYFNFHFFIITPLCALAFAYFRVQEKEAKDAVQ